MAEVRYARLSATEKRDALEVAEVRWGVPHVSRGSVGSGRIDLP